MNTVPASIVNFDVRKGWTEFRFCILVQHTVNVLYCANVFLKSSHVTLENNFSTKDTKVRFHWCTNEQENDADWYATDERKRTLDTQGKLPSYTCDDVLYFICDASTFIILCSTMKIYGNCFVCHFHKIMVKRGHWKSASIIIDCLR